MQEGVLGNLIYRYPGCAWTRPYILFILTDLITFQTLFMHNRKVCSETLFIVTQNATGVDLISYCLFILTNLIIFQNIIHA